MIGRGHGDADGHEADAEQEQDDRRTPHVQKGQYVTLTTARETETP
jgi:hypothetical protein